MRKAGAHTLAAENSLVAPAAERILPLHQIAGAMIEMAHQPSAYRTAQ